MSRVCVSGVCVCVCLVCVCGLAVIIYNLKRGRSLAPPLFACHSVCVCVPHFRFRLPLPLLLFISCFAHCSTLSTLATAEAFLLNKLQTQLTFHVFFIATPLRPTLPFSHSFLCFLSAPFAFVLYSSQPTRLSLASFSFLRLHLHFCNLCVLFYYSPLCLMRFLIMYVSFSFPPSSTLCIFSGFVSLAVF